MLKIDNSELMEINKKIDKSLAKLNKIRTFLNMLDKQTLAITNKSNLAVFLLVLSTFFVVLTWWTQILK
jgi:hypothetical protein